jgi:phosphotransferase system enzyme I (PtsI)
VIEVKEEVRLKGTSVSDGIAIGTLYYLRKNEKFQIPEYPLLEGEISGEIDRYRAAILTSKEELERLKFYLKNEGSLDAVSVIEAHIQMLSDPLLIEEVEKRISLEKRNTESVFLAFIEEYLSFFEGSEDPEMHERLLDVKDLATRILRHLHPNSCGEEKNIPSCSIVIAYELIPSHIAEVSSNHVSAYVTEVGGPTSHAGLIAKSKGIPSVTDIPLEQIELAEGAVAIVDGYEGSIILYPSDATMLFYSEKRNFLKNSVEAGEEIPMNVQTEDGIQIDVQANLENLHDIDALKKYKVQTIGLVRSEFLYLKKELDAFGEEEQFNVYKKLMQLSGNIEVTFRVFDVGSDKKFFKLNHGYEANPALGHRSIRFLLQQRELFSIQIRAILKASIYGKLRLLLPLITDIEELREAKRIIQEEKDRLRKDGYVIAEKILIGCMVEVPAFVMMCDQFVKECDFLSIGTNDLAQYTLVADRGNPRTASRYRQDHPSILRMIKKVAEEGEKGGIPVSICGEMASNPEFTELLISLGIRIFSCPPRFIPLIKKKVQSCRLKEIML